MLISDALIGWLELTHTSTFILNASKCLAIVFVVAFCLLPAVHCLGKTLKVSLFIGILKNRLSDWNRLSANPFRLISPGRIHYIFLIKMCMLMNFDLGKVQDIASLFVVVTLTQKVRVLIILS